ncbi:hypothetical protein ACSFB8_09635 [Enterococcus faecalis]
MTAEKSKEKVIAQRQDQTRKKKEHIIKKALKEHENKDVPTKEKER